MAVPARRLGQLSVDREYSPAARHVELPAQEFIFNQAVSAIFLLIAAVVALAWANSPWAEWYFRLWDAKVSFQFGIIHFDESLHHWINDGLMSLFFFLVGMEIKHEVIHGHLSSLKRAALPIVAALGGMLVPALIFYSINWGHGTTRGWGIPMATDIAFAVGILALVPGIAKELKVFLLALAIVDDLGAILVIAVFYTEQIHIVPLFIGALIIAAIELLRVAKVRFGFPYIVLGLLFWFLILESGIHATIAGVVLAFLVSTRAPFGRSLFEEKATPVFEEYRDALEAGDMNRADASLGAIEALAVSTDPPIERLTRALHPWVAFVVLPLFAFANSGVQFSSATISEAFKHPVLWGVSLGLILGKPIGIVLFSFVAKWASLTDLPVGVSPRQLAGAGILAGIGFTVAIFISDLAYSEEPLVNTAKTGILISSLLSGVVGYIWLHYSPHDRRATQANSPVSPANSQR